MLSIIYRDLIRARAPLITYSALIHCSEQSLESRVREMLVFDIKLTLLACLKLSFIDVLWTIKTRPCAIIAMLFTRQLARVRHRNTIAIMYSGRLLFFETLKSNWEITYGWLYKLKANNIAYNSSKFRLLIGLLVWRTHLILCVRRGFMSPIVSVSVGGITALRAWHRPTIDWLDSYPGTYIVMTALVHVQCLSCCLCNLWEVMAVAVSVVYRTLALTPHIKTVIKVTPAPVLMGLIPCHHTWCQNCT